MKLILTSLRVNSELDQNSYPTLNPLQQEMITSHCKAIQPVPNENERDGRVIIKGNSGNGLLEDNRFPSSPVSDFNDNLS